MDGVDAGLAGAAAAEAAQARVDADPSLRAVLRAARAWGVSPGRFLGREPETHLLPRQDGGWRVAREPEWTDDDRHLALALAMYEADLCPGCQQPLSETTLPEREDAYRPLPAVRCHRCTASSIGAEMYGELPHASALLLPVELRDSVAPSAGVADGAGVAGEPLQ